MTMNWFWAGFALTAVVGVLGRRRLWSERGRRESLSAPTAALIWMSYLDHLGLTLMAAIAGRWPFMLNDLLSVGAGARPSLWV
jgi:hypothetical protein